MLRLWAKTIPPFLQLLLSDIFFCHSNEKSKRYAHIVGIHTILLTKNRSSTWKICFKWWDYSKSEQQTLCLEEKTLMANTSPKHFGSVQFNTGIKLRLKSSSECSKTAHRAQGAQHTFPYPLHSSQIHGLVLFIALGVYLLCLLVWCPLYYQIIQKEGACCCSVRKSSPAFPEQCLEMLRSLQLRIACER